MSDSKEKTKVVIITRSGEYIEENNKSKKGRECYGNAINDNTYFPEKSIIREIICNVIAERNLNNWDEEDLYSMAENEGINIPDDEKYLELNNARNFVFEELAERVKEKVKNSTSLEKFYSSFSKQKDGKTYDITMLLWDKLLPWNELKINKPGDIKITKMDEFITELCKDLEIVAIDNGGDAILYVHDKQIGHNGDQIIIDAENSTDDKTNTSGYEIMKKYFKYVAAFAHGATGGIFQDNILKFEFGPPIAEKISKKEPDAKMFRHLREESDKILNE
ncbi:MAG: hypothetical protein IJR13_07210 [Bacteroidales bacterium]|nr:hypothetical protein [Bacteroidales bacterium]